MSCGSIVLTLNGRKSRIIPSGYLPVIDEPLELPLGHQRVGEAKTREVLDADSSVLEARNIGKELDRVNIWKQKPAYPIILGLTVVVLVTSQSVRDSLNAIYDGASEVVDRVNLKLVARSKCPVSKR